MIDHEIVMEISDEGIYVNTLYIEGVLIDKYPIIVPNDFYETLKIKLAYAEIIRDINNIQRKYC